MISEYRTPPPSPERVGATSPAGPSPARIAADAFADFACAGFYGQGLHGDADEGQQELEQQLLGLGAVLADTNQHLTHEEDAMPFFWGEHPKFRR